MKRSEVNLAKYMDMIKSKVGNTYELEFQSSRRSGESAGKFEIISFTPGEIEITLDGYYAGKGEEVVDSVKLGKYSIKFIDTKFYKNKVVDFPCKVYFGLKHREEDAKVYIENVNMETGKYIRAYDFGFI